MQERNPALSSVKGENEGRNRATANFQLSRLLIFRVCQEPALHITAVPCRQRGQLPDGGAETLPTSRSCHPHAFLCHRHDATKLLFASCCDRTQKYTQKVTT